MNQQNTKQHILMIAKDLFQTQGYTATGITQILTLAEVPKGSLYHFFPGGKEELIIETIKLSISDAKRYLKQLFQECEPGVSRIKKILAEASSHDSYEKVVPFALIALETADSHENIRQQCEMAYASILTLLAAEFQYEGVSEEVAYRLAGMLHSSLEGALVFVHTFRDRQYMDHTIHYLRTLIDIEVTGLNKHGE